MDWQNLAVFVVVLAAIAFLVRRVAGPRRKRSAPAQTFVPLEKVRRRSGHCD